MRPSYSAGMHWDWLILGLIVLAFLGLVSFGLSSWRKMTPKRRIVGFSLLTPHFLLLVCIVASLLCGHPPQGSACFNRQFVCAILILFFLPLPTLVGSIVAFVMFLRARRG